MRLVRCGRHAALRGDRHVVRQSTQVARHLHAHPVPLDDAAFLQVSQMTSALRKPGSMQPLALHIGSTWHTQMLPGGAFADTSVTAKLYFADGKAVCKVGLHLQNREQLLLGQGHEDVHLSGAAVEVL